MAEGTRDGTTIGTVGYELAIDERGLVTGRVWVDWCGFHSLVWRWTSLSTHPETLSLTTRVKGGRRVASFVSSTKGEIFNGVVVNDSP